MKLMIIPNAPEDLHCMNGDSSSDIGSSTVGAVYTTVLGNIC
jgi:hypothetical protein